MPFLSPALVPCSFGNAPAAPCLQHGDTEGFTPQLEMTLIGARTTDEQQILLVKLTTRKNLASGCILRRPCFLPIGCSEGENAVSGPRHLGGGPPSGGPWTATVSADHPTPVNRAPKAVLVRPGVPSADHYSSHGFRRGTSQELQETGSPGSAVATSEIWHSPLSGATRTCRWTWARAYFSRLRSISTRISTGEGPADP